MNFNTLPHPFSVVFFLPSLFQRKQIFTCSPGSIKLVKVRYHKTHDKTRRLAKVLALNKRKKVRRTSAAYLILGGPGLISTCNSSSVKTKKNVHKFPSSLTFKLSCSDSSLVSL